jgi:membrane protein YqaA with SNARE-associated domain
LLHLTAVGSLGRAFTAMFLSTGGLIVLAAAESTVFFWFPFGVDAAVILLAARNEERAWLYPLLATLGSVSGTALSFWMGHKAGEAGLDRYVPKQRLDAMTGRIKKKGVIALAALGIIPPPFPFTALVLAAGALGVNFLRFIAALTVVRLVRFGAEALLAARFGTLVIRWLNSDVVEYVAIGFGVIAIVGTAVTIYTLWRRTRGAGRSRSAVASTPREQAAR